MSTDFISEIVDKKIIPKLKKELGNNYNLLSNELSKIEEKYNNDEIVLKEKLEKTLDDCFPIDTTTKFYHYVKTYSKHPEINLAKFLLVAFTKKRKSKRKISEDNEFIRCIRQRKKYKLSLKDCLSVPCDLCKAKKGCSVKNTIRIQTINTIY